MSRTDFLLFIIGLIMGSLIGSSVLPTTGELGLMGGDLGLTSRDLGDVAAISFFLDDVAKMLSFGTVNSYTSEFASGLVTKRRKRQ